MKRKQIYLDVEQEKRLKRLAERTRRSEAALIREALEVYMTTEQMKSEVDPLLDLIGLCSNPEGPRDVSAKHDQYLYGKREE